MATVTFRMFDEDGVALVLALMTLLLLSAIALALVLITSTEIAVASNYRDAQVVLSAADAALERETGELLAQSDWDAVLAGVARSTFADGPPGGSRQVPGGGAINLGEVLNLANCGKAAGCAIADLDRVTADRPWGPNNPRYVLFAYGPAALLSASIVPAPRVYLVVMVADDPTENDADPLRDGLTADNPGRGILTVRAEAFGAGGAHKAIEATVARLDTDTTERGYAGQRGGGEANRRARSGPVGAVAAPPARTEILVNPGGR
jgi:hypothetical protein